MTNAIIFLVAMFIIYNYLIFEFIDTLLEKPRLKKIFRIPVAIVNTIFALGFTLISGSTSFASYIAIGVILFTEFVVFYKDKHSCSLFCALACTIHIMAVRALCVAGFALAMGKTVFDITDSPYLLVVSMGTTFILLNIATLLVMKFIPSKSVRIINQHNEQLWFMVAWLSVSCLYMLANSTVYGTQSYNTTLIINQVVAPAAILIGTYIILLFAIKTGELLGYKEKTEELENTLARDRRYRMSIDKGVFRIIEINFSKGILISGFEDYEEQLGDEIYDYRKMLATMLRTTVHAEDREEFIKYLSPITVVEEFEKGKSEIIFDYRRLMPDGSYVWMHVLMALMRDTQSGDVKGFVQIKDIDIEKRQQIELKYKAERDLLTGLYNKGTTELMIAKRLLIGKENNISGVLYIIDIDNFKTINDRLGHLYGDAVLSELSESLRRAFREYDIVGRIGGDEFLVFAEGLHSKNSMAKKAKEICDAFLQTYANDKDEDYTVSSSVGIAIFPQDGEAFEELYKNADAALYVAKAAGKNGYTFYKEDVKNTYSSTRTEIHTNGIVQKNFKDNKIEYVFRLLYGSEDKKSAIESVLELIAKNFGFSRANIFEFNELSTHFNGVFEWCATGIASVSDNYIDMPVSAFDFVVAALAKSGGMFAAVPTDFPEYAQESYTSIGIRSIVHFSIEERDNLIGVIAFQYCIDDNFHLSCTEFEELRTICQVLSVFMASKLSNERELRHNKAIQAVMDNMNCISYVIDRETYEVYYENHNTLAITGIPCIGAKCYKVYRGYDAPCEDCPINHLSDETTSCTLELYTKKFDIYTKTSAALIDWSNDRKAMLISSVDVTEYKKT